ncbi:hypothetical protein EYR40_006427 [Pleurotus pulmonarius]|nr:hypothetical protein EYR40_006427 [Pleurotus pulmonarius]
MPDHIDLTTEPELVDFNSWIGVGREYRDVPRTVSQELESRTALSDASRSLLPSSHLTIAQLLAAQLPPPTVSLILKNPKSVFSATTPNTSLAYLVSPGCKLPTRAFLTALRNAAGQAMLDGYVSIKYWNSPDVYVSFEAFGLWNELVNLADAQVAWRSAISWMNSISAHGAASRTARMDSILHSVSWSGLIPKLGRASSVTHMAKFFSSSFLSSDHLDAMLLRLRARHRDEVRNESHITLFPTLSFTTQLATVASKNTVLSVDELLEMQELSVIGNFVATSQRDVLIATLAYWPNHHWGFIMIKISGGRVQVNWGDGLQLKIPSQLKEGVKLWSRRYMPKHFLTIDSQYPCARQNDGYSCGIIAVNALQHYTLGTPLWTGATREQLRVGEFFSCMEFCQDNQTVDAPLIPSFLPLATAISPVPPTVAISPVPPAAMPSQSTKRQRGNSNTISSHVSTPVSPPRPAIKRPRRGSRLNLNTAVVPIVARGSILPEGDSPVASLDDEVDLVPFKGKKDGKSDSMILKERKNAAADKGAFVVNKQRWDTYVGKLRELDKYVEVFGDNPRTIRNARCSACAKIIKQSEPYNTYRFKQHISRCKAKGSKLHTQSITGMFTLHLDKSLSLKEPTPLVARPCSGLTVAHDDRIPQYTSRTEVRYAGGASRANLAIKHFGLTYSLLSTEQKDEVDLHYRNSCKWELDHDDQRAFSCQCLQEVQCKVDSEGLQACKECLKILTLHEFQVSISRSGSADENRKYIPFRYQSIVTGKMYATNKGLSQFVKEVCPLPLTPFLTCSLSVAFQIASRKGDFLLDFTAALSCGAFDSNPSFIQLMEVMLERHKRHASGRGLQNMRYAADFDQFCHEIQCVRPEAYRLFSSKFGGRSERSMLKIRSSKPKMTTGFSDATLKRALKYLSDYNYPHTAPLACSVDDTKLHPSLRPLYDQSQKTWFLLGSTGDPFIIADVEQLDDIIKQLAGSLATKLRLWVLCIPLPNVPPLIIGILPISESNTAPSLAKIEEKLLKILIVDAPTPLNIISLGSDGTVVERKARRLLIRSGFAAVEYVDIPHPNTADGPLRIEILRIGTRRLAIIQDSKHFRKTCRNNIFTGARQLVLGNYLVYYEQVRSMAHSQEHSPLYLRDVDKLDRQDDRAAARLFSAANIQHAIDCGHTGLAIFLFIFGEACDAYQSRTISHPQRIHMVLRAYFFKTIWKGFLVDNGYPFSRHYLSQDADDILDILVNGLLALIIIHRDYLSSPFPLLPWTHGSEANEHVFGLLRSMIPEFTVVDAIQVIPKLDIRLMAACSRKIDLSKLRRGGAGYAHSHFDGSGTDMATLSQFPLQDVFRQVAGTAWIEANAIWEVLGYFRGSTPSLSRIPVVDPDLDIDDSLDESSVEDDSVENTVSDRQVLEDALHAASVASVADHPDLTEGTEAMLNECGLAAAALNIRDLASLDELPDEDPESLSTIQGALGPILAAISALGPAGQAAVDELLQAAAQHPPVHAETIEDADLPLESAISHISQYDLSVLVDERRAHQSKESSDTCRPLTRHSLPAIEATPLCIEPSARQMLAEKIHETLRLSGINIKGETSGLARQFRWTKQASGSAPLDKDATGNTANARRAAGTRASAVRLSIPCSVIYTNGCIVF